MLHISYGVWKSEEHRGRIIGQDEAKNYILDEKNLFFKNLEFCIEERVIQWELQDTEERKRRTHLTIKGAPKLDFLELTLEKKSPCT